MTARRGLACLGDSEELGTWSGIPHYLLAAGRRNGFLDAGLNLRLEGFSRTRVLWQIGQALLGRRPRGFQYSAKFLRALEIKTADECMRLGLQEVLSHYQLLPIAHYPQTRSIATSYYIDVTLQDLFVTHGMFAWLDKATAKEAILRERDNYQAAARLVTMARWTRESLFQAYGIPEARIHTVLAGANLPEDKVAKRLLDRGPATKPQRFDASRPLRLGFTGKDWRRKGLPRLVGAIEILERMGCPAELVVMGNLPEHFRAHRQVRWMGFVDKSQQIEHFMDIIESCDLGCAPSHEEPMGIAPLEYLRLGVPVMCTAVGGLIDVCQAAQSATLSVPRDSTAENLAQYLEPLARNPERIQEMHRSAWQRKEHFRWDRAVEELADLWRSAVRRPLEPDRVGTTR